MAKPKLVARIKGGLGNQLFTYAAARRLAIANDAELVLDGVSGFKRDRLYRRHFELNQFTIPCRMATAWECMQPFERLRRGAARTFAEHKPFEKRKYIFQVGHDFDERLLHLRVVGTMYLDGLWQGYRYFSDIETLLRQDLQPAKELPEDSRVLLQRIRDSHNCVALHLRDFDGVSQTAGLNVGNNYYRTAVQVIKERVPKPFFYIFTDSVPLLRRLDLDMLGSFVVVDDCSRYREAFEDLILMSACRHFVTANSTFSWWGAWLGKDPSKVVVTPEKPLTSPVTAWNFPGLLPEQWIRV